MNNWKTSVADAAINPILRTYNFFKPDFKFETYLEVVKNGNCRHTLTKFRTSSHTLEIERGRHTNTEVNETPLCILWKNRRWKAFYSILRCHRLRAPVSVRESKLPLPGLLWPWWPWEIQISIDVRESPNIDLVIKIYLRWFSEEIMIKVNIIIIVVTSTIICLLRNIYVPDLSFNGLVCHFYLCILRVYGILASHMIYMCIYGTKPLYFIVFLRF